MAPRGRHKMKKNTRMQAALEAMTAYGFAKDLIKKKLKELLSVYGEENWLFIEENSYKILLDNILEHLEQEEQQMNDTCAGPSTALLAPPGSDAEAINTALPCNEDVEAAALVTHGSDGKDHLRLPGEGTEHKDLNLEQNSGEHQDAYVLEYSDKNSGGVDTFVNTNLLPPHSIHSGQPKDNVPIRKRKPCHGWISNDDEEVNEECIIRLEPTPFPAELAKLLFDTNFRSRRRTRWDLRPEDLP